MEAVYSKPNVTGKISMFVAIHVRPANLKKIMLCCKQNIFEAMNIYLSNKELDFISNDLEMLKK
jgi:hypothetical protein